MSGGFSETNPDVSMPISIITFWLFWLFRAKISVTPAAILALYNTCLVQSLLQQMITWAVWEGWPIWILKLKDLLVVCWIWLGKRGKRIHCFFLVLVRFVFIQTWSYYNLQWNHMDKTTFYNPAILARHEITMSIIVINAALLLRHEQTTASFWK